MVQLDAVLKMNGTLRAFPARAGLNSAPGWKIDCTPIGAMRMGEGSTTPNIVVCRHSMSVRGLNSVDDIPLSYVGVH